MILKSDWRLIEQNMDHKRIVPRFLAIQQGKGSWMSKHILMDRSTEGKGTIRHAREIPIVLDPQRRKTANLIRSLELVWTRKYFQIDRPIFLLTTVCFERQ